MSYKYIGKGGRKNKEKWIFDLNKINEPCEKSKEQMRNSPVSNLAIKACNNVTKNENKQKTLSEYIKLAHENAINKGFHDKDKKLLKHNNDVSLSEYKELVDYNTNMIITKDLALVITEIAEAIEFARKNKFCTNKNDWKETFEEEIADTFIRLFDFCGHYGIDIENFIDKKMAYNKEREHLHGKKF